MIKYVYKSWSGLTKYIKKQILSNRAIDLPLVGRFFPNDDGKAIFVPHLDFVNSGRFSFPQNEFNISPLASNVPKSTALVISLGAIAKQCEYDSEIVASILKDVFSHFIRMSRKGVQISLNL